MKSNQGITVVEVLIILAVLGIILALLFPGTGNTGISAGRKAQAKNDVTQLASAVKAYETEYGHLPANADGLVDARLMSILVGSNRALNPRNIVFIEVAPAERDRSGMRDSVFVDPWGGGYRIAIASGTNASVIAGTNQIEVRKKVAAWNDPNLQRDAASSGAAKKNRRYVTSWE